MTKIEWVKGAGGAQGKTWNPVVGCSIASPGCTNCYAMRMAARLEAMGVEHYRGLTKPSKAGAVWTGKVALAPEKVLLEPLRRKKPTTYFVNSMGDLFHEDVPDELILRVLDVIRQTSYDGGSGCGTIGSGYGEHTYQLLTKRTSRMRSVMSRLRWDGERLFLSDTGRRLVMKNLWLGTSVEDQKRAGERRDDLKALAEAGWTTFVSYEPALGPVNWTGWAFISWLISGDESGRGARAGCIDWHRRACDFCQLHSIAFFHKQRIVDGRMVKMPELDGRTWDEMPSRGASQ